MRKFNQWEDIMNPKNTQIPNGDPKYKGKIQTKRKPSLTKKGASK
jgi:hypothetical protein